MSPSTWRLADLFAKHAFLLNGLGWGGMPLHVVQHDLIAGRLVELRIEDIPSGGMILPMSAAYPTLTPPGPAGRWLIDRMKPCAAKPKTKYNSQSLTVKASFGALWPIGGGGLQLYRASVSVPAFGDSFGAGPDAKLPEDRLNMKFDRVKRNIEPSRNRLVT